MSLPWLVLPPLLLLCCLSLACFMVVVLELTPQRPQGLWGKHKITEHSTPTPQPCHKDVTTHRLRNAALNGNVKLEKIFGEGQAVRVVAQHPLLAKLSVCSLWPTVASSFRHLSPPQWNAICWNHDPEQILHPLNCFYRVSSHSGKKAGQIPGWGGELPVVAHACNLDTCQIKQENC